jgi:hypothetical protein
LTGSRPATAYLRRLVLLLVLLPLPWSLAAAQVYKWVDDNGRVHYGDRPRGEDAVPVEIHQGPDPDPAMTKRRQKRQRLLEIFNEDRQERRRQQEAARRKQREYDRRCDEARRSLEATLNASYLYEKSGDPDNPRILTAEERRVEIEMIRKQVEIWCG